MKTFISSCALALGLAMGLSACTDPYDPGQRAIGGGLFGAATGAAIGGIAGGGRGAATGALIGGGVGALGALPRRPATTDTTTTDLAITGTVPTHPATMDPVTDLATDLATTDLVTMELAITDTATSNY